MKNQGVKKQANANTKNWVSWLMSYIADFDRSIFIFSVVNKKRKSRHQWWEICIN